MAAVNIQRHTAALRALLGTEQGAPDDDPAPGYDGPAAWFGPSTSQALANAQCADLRCDDGEFDPAVLALASEVFACRGPRSREVTIELKSGRARRFTLTGIPQGGGVLVLGRETSKEANEIQALKSSLAMYRDVTRAAGGFAFETDERGVFSWIGSGETFGFGPAALIGRPGREFLQETCDAAFDPFVSGEQLDDMPVWVRSFDQGSRALRMSVRPVFDKMGVWRGVRGHARDETDSLRHARLERFRSEVVESMRSTRTPLDLMTSIASSAAQACGVAASWIFSSADGNEYAASDAYPPCEMMRQISARTINEGVQYPSLFCAGDWSGLAIALRAQGESQGALIVAERLDASALNRDAQEMLRLIAPMASAAMAQARLLSKSQIHAIRDGLTGLPNRKGWLSSLEMKLKDRTACSVILIECDRFKAFGDGLGKVASEELLVEIAGGLKALSGPAGLCARVDEAVFAIWMSAVDEASLDRKKDEIAVAFKAASRRMSLPLSVTPLIGAATAAPDKAIVTAEQMTADAAQVLNDAKRRPRGRGDARPCSKT